MTFYEELGVPPDAPSDTIREAYRNVARLLHPDAQTNPVLKESAEVQMKRINHLYEVLSDPERRRRYDQELTEPPDRKETIIIQAPSRPEGFERGNHGTLVWLAATAVCATFIIWLATRESSMPAVYPQASFNQNAGVSAPAMGSSALRRAAAAILPKASPDRRDSEIARLTAELAAANADGERLMKQIAAMTAGRTFQPPPAEARQPSRVTPSLNLPPAPLVAPASPMEISLPAISPALPPPPQPAVAARPAVSPAPPKTVPKARWSGDWAYIKPRAENKSQALVPPEFIETFISEENGRIRGRYHARFQVSRAGISPDVDFRFEGTISGSAGSFPWTGPSGARGDVQIRLLSDTALEVVWSATSLGKSMGLASGTAVLNRRK